MSIPFFLFSTLRASRIQWLVFCICKSDSHLNEIIPYFVVFLFSRNIYIFSVKSERRNKNQQPENPTWVWMDSRIANCIDKYVHNQLNQITTVSDYKLSVWRHHIAIFIAIGLVVLEIQQQWNIMYMYICTLQLSSIIVFTPAPS